MAAVVQNFISSTGKMTGKAYQELLDQLLVKFTNDPLAMKEGLEAFISAVLEDGLSIVEAKTVLSYFADNIPGVHRQVVKEVCQSTLTKIHPRIISFEEQCLVCGYAMLALNANNHHLVLNDGVICDR
jgi:COP9 signalosome complex subunit 4